MTHARKTYRQRQTFSRHLQIGALVAVNLGLIIGLLLAYPTGSQFKIADWLLLLAMAIITGIALKIIQVIGANPPRLFCTHCGKYIDPRLDWQCGYCDHHNATTLFIEACVNCEKPPKAFRCPSCQAPNFLDEDRDATHAAFNPASIAVEEPVDIKVQREEILEGKRYDVNSATLDLELAEILAKIPKPPEPPPKKKTVEEIINEDYERHFARDQAVDKLKHRVLKRINDEYKDDPDELKHQTERLMCWVDGHRG